MSKNASSQPAQSISSTTLTVKTTTPNQDYLQIYPSLGSEQQFFYADPPIFPQNKDAPRISPLRPEYYPQTANMMSHRDVGYGYMPQAVPAYSAAPSHYGNLAAMSGYYPEVTRHLSTSPNPGYLSNPIYPRYSISTEDREKRHSISAEDREKRRRRNSTDRRHQTKLLARKSTVQSTVQSSDSVRAASMSSRLPSVMGVPLEESPIQTSPIDMFTTQASLHAPTYATDHYSRAASYEPTPSLRGDEYRTASLQYNMPQQTMSSPPTYPAVYSMATMGPTISSLAPLPHIPSPTQHNTYPGADRSSPLLAASMQGPISTTHSEPLIIDQRRDKPQCWEHGCNGREFSTFSNLLRHQREKSGSAAKAYCPRCGAEFTRTTARNGHMEHGKCKSRRASVAGNSTISQTGSVSSAAGSISGIASLR